MIIDWTDPLLEPKVEERQDLVNPKRDRDVLRLVTFSEHEYFAYELKYRHGIVINDLWVDYWNNMGNDVLSTKGITARFNYFWNTVDYMCSIY